MYFKDSFLFRCKSYRVGVKYDHADGFVNFKHFAAWILHTGWGKLKARRWKGQRRTEMASAERDGQRGRDRDGAIAHKERLIKYSFEHVGPKCLWRATKSPTAQANGNSFVHISINFYKVCRREGQGMCCEIYANFQMFNCCSVPKRW